MSPLPKDPQKAEAILKAAVKVFSRDGLDKGTIADIAKEAGIGKGTVYEYFSSKDEIFNAIEGAMMDELVGALEHLHSMEISPTDKVRTFMRMGTEMIFEMQDSVLILTELWAQSARKAWGSTTHTALMESYNHMRDLLILILEEGIQAGEFRQMNKDGVATLCTAFVDGLIWQFLIIRDKDRFEKIVEEGVLSFMRGIMA